jgi:pilus assembly protein Flp/PilA
MRTRLPSFLNDQRGSTAVEYGLIAALIALVLVTAVGAIGDSLSNAYNNVASALDD